MDVKPIIVGVDGSQDSVRALRWAADHAHASRAPLQVLAAYDVPAMYGLYAMAHVPSLTTVENDTRTMLVDTVRDALGEDVEVTERVMRGHPAQALVEASAEAQILVVGSRGRGGFTGMLLGSVSQHVISHSQCPVVVMPHGAADEA